MLAPVNRVCVTAEERGSISDTVRSSRFATHRRPAPAAMAPGRTPTAIALTTASREGSMIATELAVATIRRCRPRMLVEVEDRLSPGGLARAKAYFKDLGYCGYYVHHGRLNPIDQFSVAALQKPCDLPDLTATLKERERFGRYIYNFIFLPPGEPAETLHRLSDRLSQL